MFFSENLAPEVDILSAKNEEFKSLLLASVSHELRTPLNGTIGVLQGAESLKDTHKEIYQEYILPARNSSLLLFYVINDLIDFSLLNAGHFKIEHSRFAIRETLEDILSIV